MSDYLEIMSTSSSVESIDNCIICFYPLDKEVAVLSCGHKYHFECLKSWADKKQNIGNLCCICNKPNIEIMTVYNEDDAYLINETNLDNTDSTNSKNKDKNVNLNLDRIEPIFWCCNIL